MGDSVAAWSPVPTFMTGELQILETMQKFREFYKEEGGKGF